MSTPILQTRIPYDIPSRMPGTAPLDPAAWIMVDDAFAAQMALRDELLATRLEEVVLVSEGARPAAQELYRTVLALLEARDDYVVRAETVIRPDGVTVPLRPDNPMETLGRLVQQDFCLMEKPEGEEEHVLTGAVLCFPSYWTLAEKFMRPMISIHLPVESYDATLAKRVQRLLDGVQPGRPMWRANWLRHPDPSLFHPRLENAPRDDRFEDDSPYLRSERQSLWRLPETRAVAFGIHTFVVRSPVGASDDAAAEISA